MRILLVAATQFEIDIVLKAKQKIEVLVPGVGLPVTMYHLTSKLVQENYTLVIQAGIAGSFSDKVHPGEVVLVKRDAFADVGVEEKGEFSTVFQLGFADENKFPFYNGWLVNEHPALQTTALQLVSGVTVNRVSDRKEQSLQLQQLFNADIESMEGAAVHYICLQRNIPFLQLRSVSNRVGERDKTKWKIKDAVENLNNELLKLIQTLL